MKAPPAAALALLLATARALAQDPEPPKPPPAVQMDTKSLLRFMRAEAGKFVQDLRGPGPTRGARIITRANYPGWYFNPYQYDPERQVYKFGDERTGPSDLELYRSCKPAGQYIGQNAFGAKAKIARTYCETAVIRPTNYAGVRFQGELPLTREQFRQVQKSGVPLEVEFALSKNGANEAVTKDTNARSATISSPQEVTGPEWVIYGSVREVRMLLPGGAAQSVYEKPYSYLDPEENDQSAPR